MATQRTSTKRNGALSTRQNGTSSASKSAKRNGADSARRKGTASVSKSAQRNGADSARRKGTASVSKSAQRNGADSAHLNGTAKANKAAKRTSVSSARRNGTSAGGRRGAVIEGLTTRPGEHFFSNVVRSLAVALHARFGFVSKVAEEPKSLELLAIWTGDDFGECITYPMKGTPCEHVLGKNLVTIQKGVQREFPKDVWLAEIGAESYMAVPLLGSDGRPIGHMGIIHDSPLEASDEQITVLQAFATRAAGELQRDIEQRQAKQRVDRVEAVVNKAAVGAIQVDAEGTIVFANPHVERLFGYERGELLGQPIEVLVPDGQKPRHREDRSHYLRTPTDRGDVCVDGRRKDGSLIPVTVALSADGRGAVAIISDATKARQAFEKAEKSHARLEAVVQAFPEMTFLMDREGVLLDHVSDGLVLHISPQAFLGKPLADVLPPEAADRILQAVRQALKTRKVQRVRYALTWDDGVHKQEARLVRLDNERVVAFVRDFTVEEWQKDETHTPEPKADPRIDVERRMEWRNPYRLSYREFSVLYLLKGGTTDKEIAEDLGISVFTVNKHVSNILTKMSAASRTEATIRALQEGLID